MVFKKIKNMFTKSSNPRFNGLASFILRGGTWSPDAWLRYNEYASKGYTQCVISFAAINKIASGIASIPWILKNGNGDIIDKHPALDLISRPNPNLNKKKYIELLVCSWYLCGEYFVKKLQPAARSSFRELWPIRPDKVVKIERNKTTKLINYYEISDGESNDSVSSDLVLHEKFWNPLDEDRGLSPLKAAALHVDQHNEAHKFSYSLLNNQAVPSGALTVPVSEANPTGSLNQEEYDRLKGQIENNFSRSNAGKPLLLEGGMTWTPFSFSMADLQWLDGVSMSDKLIALALEFPPILLGLNDPTYNNQKEARLDLWENTIIPRAQQIVEAHNEWLQADYGDVYFELDTDDLQALAYKKEVIWDRVQNSQCLTINEKREAIGYDKLDGGDVILVPMAVQPLDQIQGSPGGLEDVE